LEAITHANFTYRLGACTRASLRLALIYPALPPLR
jgi:hypothetical protein